MLDSQGRILVVDDDAEIRDLLADYLVSEGFEVITEKDGRNITSLVASEAIDLIILDLMLPGEDGLSICRRIRAEYKVPIVMLTAKGEDIDRIIGIEMGADDYLPKPFNPRELVARLKAVLRRTMAAGNDGAATEKDDILEFDGFTINSSTRELIDPQGEYINLSSAEFDLLLLMASNFRQIMSRDELMEQTHGRSIDPSDRSLDMLVARLRRKIEKSPENPRIIKTIRGAGYTFTPAVTRP